MKTRFEDLATQEAGLTKLRDLISSGSVDPQIITAARAIAVANCPDRDDECQVQAIFEAVKHGTKAVPWLRRGLRYISDPRPFDTFATCAAIIEMCQKGAYAADCDEHTVLVGSLVAAIGFQVGARAWGPSKSQDGEYTHVYCVVALPRSPPGGKWPKSYSGHGMDTTEAHEVGWEPPGGHVMTAWLSDT